MSQSGNTPNWEMTKQDWFAVIGATLGAFMAILDIQITNASSREIQGSLGLDFSESGWISTSYLIAEIIVIPLTGFLSKIFGMKRYMTVNCVIFVMASMLCGFAWNLPSMIVFRVLQGLSGGILIPMAFQTMLLFMPPQRKAVGLTLFGLTATLAPTLGPAIGGWLTDNYGWRTIFFINIVPGTLMVMAVLYGMPSTRLQLEKLKKMDFVGTLLLIFGLGTLTYMLEEGAKLEWFESTTIQICFLITLICIPSFIGRQLLRKNPLLNLDLLANRNFSLAAFVTMMSAMSLYGGIYALSLYLAEIQNYGAQDIGKVMMFLGLPQLVVMPTLPYLMKKVDLRILTIVGMGLFAFSNFLNTGMNADFSGEQMRTSLMVRALGQPLFMIPLSTMAMAMITPSEAGNASSIYNVIRNLGGSIGIALTGTFLISRQSMHFNHYIGSFSIDDPQVVEKLYGMQQLLMSRGLDSISSKEESLKAFVKLAQRDSLIQSFDDVYMVMALGLALCAILLIFFKPVKVTDTKIMME